MATRRIVDSGSSGSARRDTYSSFAELASCQMQGEAFQVRLLARGSGMAVLAPHGGRIEPGTSELAEAIAGEELSFYAFEGIKPVDNHCLHLTSTRFDEPRCLELLSVSESVLTIHGEHSLDEIIFVGGRDVETARRLSDALEQQGFAVSTPAAPGLRGRHPANLCNRGRCGTGVQLELSRGLRRSLFQFDSRTDRSRATPLFEAFVAAARGVLVQDPKGRERSIAVLRRLPGIK